MEVEGDFQWEENEENSELMKILIEILTLHYSNVIQVSYFTTKFGCGGLCLNYHLKSKIKKRQ